MDVQYPYSCFSSVIDLVAAAYMAYQFVTVAEQPSNIITKSAVGAYQYVHKDLHTLKLSIPESKRLSPSHTGLHHIE